MDTVFSTYVRQFGFYAAVRFARNLGISFHDCYFMAFGRLPACQDIPFGGINGNCSF